MQSYVEGVAIWKWKEGYERREKKKTPSRLRPPSKDFFCCRVSIIIHLRKMRYVMIVICSPCYLQLESLRILAPFGPLWGKVFFLGVKKCPFWPCSVNTILPCNCIRQGLIFTNPQNDPRERFKGTKGQKSGPILELRETHFVSKRGWIQNSRGG